MKPIENIFGFDCGTCEHNRHCYGGNMGNQFRYCQKSTEKIQNLDKLEKENELLKEKIENLELNWEIIKQYFLVEKIPEEYDEYNSYIEFSNSVYDDIFNKMENLELEQGSDCDESMC